MNRETWLNEMAEKMRPRFAALGFPLPKFRVAVGFTSAGQRSDIGGECWSSANSADSHFEILISPILSESMHVSGVLAHELIHAAVGLGEGHKGNFAKVALAIGLQRPMTATTEGPEFIQWIQPYIDELGALPHGKLSWAVTTARKPANDNDGQDGDESDEQSPGSSNARPKQKTRMLKAICETEGCGYTVRLSKKWAESLGACCPTHGNMTISDAKAPEDDAEAA